MPLPSEVIKMPEKWKGSPEMKEVAEQETWPDFLEIVDELKNMTAYDLMVWIGSWYMRVGYANLGKMIVAGQRAHAKVELESETASA